MTISAPPPQTGDLAGLARQAFAALTDAASLAAVSDTELLALSQQAEELGRVVDGVRVLAAGEIADRSRPGLGVDGLASHRGCRHAAELLERATLVSGVTARTRMAAGAYLRSAVSLTGELLPAAFPEVRRAVADGILSLDAAGAIIRALGPVRDRGADPEVIRVAESELLAAATGRPGTDAAAAATPDEVRVMAQTWALVLDPDGALPDDSKGLRRRELSIGRLREGTVPLRGELLPEVAAQLQRLLDAYLNPRVENEASQGPVFRDDSDVVEDPEHRSTRQKRHDALAGVLSIAAAHPDAPTLGGASPTLVVAVTPDQLNRPDGVAFIQGTDGEQGAVPVTVARHSGCAGAVQRIVQGTNGRILQLGLPQRVFSGHQRRAITLRDGECIIPGCHVPATWCEIHHVDAAARGGATHTDNGVLLCWFHHRTIDSGGWAIEMRDGVPWVRPPGWVDPRRTWQMAGSPLQRWRRRRYGDSP
jgi:hypothetical protein